VLELGRSQPDLSCDGCWRAISKSQFLVLSYVNDKGVPRSSGVVFGTVRPHLGVAVAPDGVKARELKDGQAVSVTVLVRKGGILSLFIPPATITFRARARVHAPGTLDAKSLAGFAPHHPESMRQLAYIIELVPEGRFLTYGIGIPLTQFRDPTKALRRAPIS
jgi:hypothetical protein